MFFTYFKITILDLTKKKKMYQRYSLFMVYS